MARLQISDRKNNLLTVKVMTQFVFLAGQWMPDSPGKVLSSRNPECNPVELSRASARADCADAVCYTIDSTGARILVMRFNGATGLGGFNLFLKKGSGYIYPSGNLTMTEGIFTWTNLDLTTSILVSEDSDDDSGADA